MDSDLDEAYLGWSNLEYANLTRAEMNHTVFTQAKLGGVELVGYSISFGRVPINLAADSFGRLGLFRRPKIDEEDSYSTQVTYRALKRYFMGEADYDSASWASYCERLMQRKNLWVEREYLRWVASSLFSAGCGYGERPGRVVLVAILLVLMFTIAYHVLRVCIQAGQPTGWFTALYFSAATFCGYSSSDLVTRSTVLARSLVTIEAFCGVFVLGLFIFTLTKRFVAR
ncbi:MAG: pentapeptide repeat-containing protein [Terriglobia bacterium]